MVSFGKNKMSADRSFLPEDYLSKRAERRTNLVSLTLFTVVMVGVVGAFLVTNREWKDVQSYQEAINVRYSTAAKQIEQLKQLEAQKAELLKKAELTTALIERVPRTILMAEVINRMPEEMTLLEFELRSKRVASMPAAMNQPVRSAAQATRTNPNMTGGMSAPAATAPQYHTRVMIEGVTTTHNNVARFGAGLQDNPLLSNIELVYSELTAIKGEDLNKFRIEADVTRNADARRLETVSRPTIRAFDGLDNGAGGGDALTTENTPAGESQPAAINNPTKPQIKVRSRTAEAGEDKNGGG